MKRPVLLIAVLFFYQLLQAQLPAAYHRNAYTTENGLPANGIKGMQWDEKTGFLWIATEAGISRFNGIDFKNFTIANTSFIASERMSFMVKNNAGKIITADQYGNLFYVEKNQLLFYGNLKKKERGYFNNTFAVNISESMYRDPAPFKGTIPTALIFDLAIPLSDQDCYFIHNQVLYYFRTGMPDLVRCADTTRVRYGFIKKGRTFLVDPEGRLSEIPGKDKMHIPVLIYNEDGTIFNELSKECRLFWTNGMEEPILIKAGRSWVLELINGKIVAIPLCDEIPTDTFIFSVQYSRNKGIIFIGTDSKGIVVLTRNKLSPMKPANAKANERNAYYSQIALSNGNVLTNQGTIIGSGNMKGIAIPIKGKFNFKTSATGDSLIWYTQFDPVVNQNCLFRYDRRNGTTTCLRKVLGAEIIVARLQNGEYAITTEFGIGKLSGDSIKYIYRYPEVSYNNESYSFLEIKPDVILMATCSGIIQFNLRTAKADTVLRSVGYCVRTLWKYKEYVFFGTYGKGIFVWKNGDLRSLPLDKRNYLLYSHCFQPDANGFCWISTNRGLFKASIDEMVNAYEKKQRVIYYHYYGKNDGMDITEMNGGCAPCALQLPDSTISFPTMDGLLWVKPSMAQPILPEGDIYLEDITADGIAQPALENGSDFTLHEKARDLAISLAFPAWCGKENIYLDYQLNDTLHWTPLNSDNDAVIRFNNLPPGNYTLRIRKLNGFGLNNYSYKSISFTIPTPWYQTWWFYLLMFISIFALLLFYVNYRTRRLKSNQLRLETLVADKTNELLKKNETLEKNDSIKTRLISIISHDIITPLKFLNSAGKNLMEKRSQMSEDLQQETISEITTTSQELQLLSTNILNWIKYQNENRRLGKEQFSLYDLVQQVFGVLNSMARHKDTKLLNEVSPDLRIVEFFEPLKIVVYNLVSNAINFSDKGSIRVQCREVDQKLVITVKDEGTGMSPEQILHVRSDDFIISSVNVDKRKGNGLGYLIIKDLLKMMKGELQIQSEKGKGTEVSILLSFTKP